MTHLLKTRLMTILGGVLLSGSFCVCVPHAQTQELTKQQKIVRIQALAEEKRFEAALDEIQMLEQSDPNNYDIRLLKARILSWAGRYGLAEDEFESLLQQTPGNPDVLLAYGYWSYYQGDNKTAESRFETILADYPNYEDARTGLEIVRRVDRENRSIRFDIGSELSQFSRSNNADWSQTYAQLSIQRERSSWGLRYDHYDRFSLTDEEFGVSHYRKIGTSLDAGVSFSGVVNADFRPETSLSGVLGWTQKFNHNKISALRTFGSVKFDSYEAQKISSLNSGLELYLANGVVLSGSLITVKPGDSGRRYGFLSRVNAPVSKRLDIGLGVANSPETVNAVVIRTQTVFGTLAYKASDDLTFRLSASRDDRENSFIRESVSVGLSREF